MLYKQLVTHVAERVVKRGKEEGDRLLISWVVGSIPTRPTISFRRLPVASNKSLSRGANDRLVAVGEE
jgi:hypothetical protein